VVQTAFGLNLDDQGAMRIGNTATLGWVSAGHTRTA
jgi:hypothetical protein